MFVNKVSALLYRALLTMLVNDLCAKIEKAKAEGKKTFDIYSLLNDHEYALVLVLYICHVYVSPWVVNVIMLFSA